MQSNSHFCTYIDYFYKERIQSKRHSKTAHFAVCKTKRPRAAEKSSSTQNVPDIRTGALNAMRFNKTGKEGKTKSRENVARRNGNLTDGKSSKTAQRKRNGKNEKLSEQCAKSAREQKCNGWERTRGKRAHMLRRTMSADLSNESN